MMPSAKQTLRLVNRQIKNTVDDPLRSFKFLQRTIALICIAIPVIFRACDRDELFPYDMNARLLLQRDSGFYKVAEQDTTYRFEKEVPLWTVTDISRNEKLLTSRKIEKDSLGFRKSLSHYAYSSNSYLFGLLYCMAAMLFIFNGGLYVKNAPDEQGNLVLDKGGPWYNILIGLSLIAVVLNPMYDRQVLHVIFSVLFFLGNIIVIAFFPNPKERSLSRRIRYAMAGLATVFILLPFIKSIRISVLWGEWLSLTVIALHLFLVAWYVEKTDTYGTSEP